MQCWEVCLNNQLSCDESRLDDLKLWNLVGNITYLAQLSFNVIKTFEDRNVLVFSFVGS